MAGLCKVTIVGNLGADPERRYTQDGRAVTKFRVAVNNSKKDRDGNWQEHTEWFGVTAFGRQAEMAAERLTKGSQVYVDGRLETREWDSDKGKRFFMDIVASEVLNLTARPRGEGDFNASPDSLEGGERMPARTGRGAPMEDAGDLEDLPF